MLGIPKEKCGSVFIAEKTLIDAEALLYAYREMLYANERAMKTIRFGALRAFSRLPSIPEGACGGVFIAENAHRR
ncbi:hypothetical protein AB4043_24895, partial [Terriglobus sp. YAF25]|uniref:hypothetical protein n=1 Tax=Terriglobus sp. YAF25 TaxID=3233080 RepID=UPI003F96A34E